MRTAFLIALLVVVASGCEAKKAPSYPAAKSSTVKPEINEIDVGIIFSNESSYLCFALEDLGIAHAEEIRAVRSSCDCVEPELVKYKKTDDIQGFALRLSFIAEANPEPIQRSVQLAVKVEFEFDDNRKQELDVKVLHTSPTR
jgi:hypothetical protein